ncbi:unnamed protein product [Prunus armeniaca]
MNNLHPPGSTPRVNEKVDQRCLRHGRHQRKLQALRVEDVEKLVNDRLRDLNIGGDLEDALCKEVDQVNSFPFTNEITPFKGDSDLVILYQSKDALMCKVFAMTLRGAAQDWFHTLPSASINCFSELAFVFTKEYTSYRMIKQQVDHLFNLC